MKKRETDGSRVYQLKIEEVFSSILINLISFFIVIILFELSISWLLDNLSHVHFMHNNLYMAEQQSAMPAHLEAPSRIAIALSSASSWVLGVIAIKITNSFLDHCWDLLRYAFKKVRLRK